MLQGIHNDRTHGGHIKHLENFVAFSMRCGMRSLSMFTCLYMNRGKGRKQQCLLQWRKGKCFTLKVKQLEG